MEQKNFRDCTLVFLDRTFGLRRLRKQPALTEWITTPAEILPHEETILQLYKQSLEDNVQYWNEQELSLNFIGPIFSLVNFTEPYQYGFFAQRTITATVGNYELSGKPDGMIASGYGEPEIPFFAFQEYKRESDPNGEAAGQCLAAMLVGQTLNENTDIPIYGCYAIGREWYFMTLIGKEYAISNNYSATTDDIGTILQILKSLKQIVIDISSKLLTANQI
jgi:hypothetical protein